MLTRPGVDEAEATQCIEAKAEIETENSAYEAEANYNETEAKLQTHMFMHLFNISTTFHIRHHDTSRSSNIIIAFKKY